MSTRVLLIDSDIAFVVSIKTALEKTGEFSVSISANGLAAEDALRRHRHDVAVIDFDLPDMDALEMIALLHRIQSDLPVIMTPETPEQQERIRFMDVEGSIRKPYVARDLIPYIRSVLTRARSRAMPPKRDEFVAPQMPPALLNLMKPVEQPDQGERTTPEHAESPDVLEEFEAVERSRTILFDEPSAGSTILLEADAAPGSSEQEWQDPGSTQRLPPDDQSVHSATTAYLESHEADPTQTLPDTDTFDALIRRQGWVSRKAETTPLPPREDELPPVPEDTRNVPAHDLDSMRQFLATDNTDAGEFGEVLDAVAHSEVYDHPGSPDDRAFHDLLDSMRVADEPKRSRLEELLASIAADASQPAGPGDELPPGDSPLDYLLEAIRRGKSLSPAPLEPSSADLDDTTIGEAISRLFDPAFEGVLAALAGEEISDENYAEPTYSGKEGRAEPVEPPAEDRIPLEEMSAEDSPDWLRGYESEGIPPPATLPEERPLIEEPPVSLEDSSGYPATAALSAVTGEGEGFSLDDLLSQIEQQLPPPRANRPRLKPLPSWEREAAQEEAERLAALFDRMEKPVTQEHPPAPSEEFALPEPPPGTQDTQPSASLLEDLEHVETQEIDTQPYETLLEELVRDEFEPVQVEWGMPEHPTEHDAGDLLDRMQADLDLLGDEAEYDDTASEPAATLGYPAEEALPAAEPPLDMAALFDDSGEEEAEPEQDWYAEFPFREGRVLSIADLLELADLPAEVEPHEESPQAQQIPSAYEEGMPEPAAAELSPDDVEAQTADQERAEMLPLEEDGLVEVPVETAALLLGGVAPEEADHTGPSEDETQLARIAVQLTQFSLESSAQATILSRPGQLLAEAGELPERALKRLFQIVDSVWQTSAADANSLIRYITLPDAGEYLLYSTLVDDGMILSMAFHANTPIRSIRRQARRLSESLALVPEAPSVEAPPASDTEPEAARTRPNRPTEVRPPERWGQAAAEHVAAPAETEAPPSESPDRPEGPYAGYTCLWIPLDPGLELLGDYADELYNWIQDIAEANAWDLEALDIRPDYVELTISIPAKTRPDSAIRQLMAETADRTAMYYPDVISDPAQMWAGGYYVVTPPRALTDREIARFITYQRQAQLG